MNRLLFVIPSFGIGGTPVSTLNLVLTLQQEGYDVSILSFEQEGGTRSMFTQSEIKIVKCPFLLRALGARSWRSFDIVIQRFFAGFIRVVSKKGYIYKILAGYYVNRISSPYNTIVACQEGPTTRIMSYCRNKRLIAWIRCDYGEYYKIVKQEEKFYNKYSHIVCVSQNSLNNFLKIYPNLSEKTSHIDNIQNSKFLQMASCVNDNDLRFIHNQFTIISVGRYAALKRYNEIPQIARTLIDRGLSFRWYIVGGLNDEIEESINNDIKRLDLNETLIQLGIKSNPLYYIKNSDLLVTLSTTEACPRVVAEAKFFGVPVVSTDFPSIYDYITDGVEGRIVPLERISDAIFELLSDVEFYNKIKDNLSDFEFNNGELIIKLKEILK